jgi:tetratricopeptide (TPR) repeat protein
LQLAELEGKLFVGASTTKVAITGPGGIGKTQLALAVAYRIRQERKNCSVFWISASDEESIHQGYAHVARRLTIPGWDDEKADSKKLVQLHLSKESAGQWLLVFDNADEAITESAGSSKIVGLMEFLPSSEQGAIVFTTADRKMAAKLAPQNVIELPEMEQDTAERMLKMCLVNPVDEQKGADVLMKELAYLPLAILQAAAYVNVNKTTLQEYLTLLVDKKAKLAKDLHRESGHVIAATWLISFEQISQHDLLAVTYLLFMACTDRNDIPLALLPVATPREQGIHAVATLNAYSFVTKRTGESSLDLHRLVHASTRNWLQKQGLLRQWTQVAIKRLFEVFPNSNHGSRSKWRRLLPHAKFVLSSGLTGQANWARTNVVWKCAMALYSDGRFNEAEAYFQEAVQILRKELGDEHPFTLIMMDNLALTYKGDNRWKEAEELNVQVMEMRKRVLDDEHPDMLISMGNLALTYWNQGRRKEAKELQTQVMEVRKRVLGDEHPDTLTSMGNLASTYRDLGRWKEAEELQIQVMGARKRVLGDEHSDTLTSIANLALMYSDQGRWMEAEELEMQVMQTTKRVLGDEHPDTLTSMANLASTYSSQGQWKEAKELGVQVMEARKRVLGDEHPETLISMGNLASTYGNLGRWKEAKELQTQVMEVRKRVLGDEHPDTLISMGNLASTYSSQGQWKEAEELQMQVIEASKGVLGDEHPYTLTSMGNLASMYWNQGRLKEAEELDVQVMEARKKVLGDEHPDTLTSNHQPRLRL